MDVLCEFYGGIRNRGIEVGGCEVKRERGWVSKEKVEWEYGV